MSKRTRDERLDNLVHVAERLADIVNDDPKNEPIRTAYDCVISALEMQSRVYVARREFGKEKGKT